MIFSRNTALVLFIPILLASSIGNVFAAGHLCFYCNEKREIEKASAHGEMKFAISQEEFEGKDVGAVVPLSNQNREAVLNAFNESATDGQIHYVVYTIDGQTPEVPCYLAEITPVKNIAEQVGFFVKVTENNSSETLD